MDKLPTLELNVVAKPKGNWVIPENIAEIRAALLNGTCVEILFDGDWTTANPFASYTQGRLLMWLAEKLVRFNMDKKVVYHRVYTYQMDGQLYLTSYVAPTWQHMVDIENDEEFVEWMSSRAYFAVKKDTHV